MEKSNAGKVQSVTATAKFLIVSSQCECKHTRGIVFTSAALPSFVFSSISFHLYICLYVMCMCVYSAANKKSVSFALEITHDARSPKPVRFWGRRVHTDAEEQTNAIIGPHPKILLRPRFVCVVPRSVL